MAGTGSGHLLVQFPLSLYFLHVVLKVLDCLLNVLVITHRAEREACTLLRCHLLGKAFRVSLIRQYLFFLESLLSKSNFNFNNRGFINDACARLTLVNEKFVSNNPNRLSFLDVAHKASEEVRLQDLVSNQLNCLVRLLIGLDKRILVWPDRGYSHNSHTLRLARVHLDLSTVGNRTEVGSAILDEELVLLNLKDLPLE